MTRHFLPAFPGTLAISPALTTTPAQAYMFDLHFQPNDSSCTAGVTGNHSWPTQVQPGGSDGDCLLHKRDRLDAANTMGSMATRRMEMVGGIMLWALADREMRSVPPEQGT